MDRQDNMARLFRHDLTRREALDIRGEWPAGRFVALGLHWGAGFPALAHLERSGRSPAFVYQPEDVETLGSLPAEDIFAVEVLWTPEDPSDHFSQEDLASDYPLLNTL